MKIYIWCSLTHASDEFKNNIENLKNELRKKYEILDFVWLVNWTNEDVFEWDTNCVKTCDLFLMDCSLPSLWTWYELWVAIEMNKTIVAFADKDAKVTRLVLWVNKPKFSFHRYENNILEILPIVDEKINNLK